MGGTVNKMGKGNVTSILQRRIHKTKNMKKTTPSNLCQINKASHLKR